MLFNSFMEITDRVQWDPNMDVGRMLEQRDENFIIVEFRTAKVGPIASRLLTNGFKREYPDGGGPPGAESDMASVGSVASTSASDSGLGGLVLGKNNNPPRIWYYGQGVANHPKCDPDTSFVKIDDGKFFTEFRALGKFFGRDERGRFWREQIVMLVVLFGRWVIKKRRGNYRDNFTTYSSRSRRGVTIIDEIESCRGGPPPSKRPQQAGDD